MGGGYLSVSPSAEGLGDLGLSESIIHAFVAALQGLLVVGVVAALPSPYPAAPEGKFATLSLLHLRFACRVEGDTDLPLI